MLTKKLQSFHSSDTFTLVTYHLFDDNFLFILHNEIYVN